MLFCLAALAVPAQAPAAFPGPSGKIVFVSNLAGPGRYYIYKMKPNGSHRKRLTHHRSDAYPVFSASGKKIAFNRYSHGSDDIYTMRADGTHEKRLTRGPANEVVGSFSPSGKKIVFAGSGGIYTMRANGSHKKLLPDTQTGSTPVFSPNGKRIAFANSWGNGSSITVMRVDGTHQRRLTRRTPAVYDNDPDFSPNGKKLVFTRYDENRSPEPEIYKIGINGRHLKRLTRSSASSRAASFSPKGKRIVFESDRHRRPGSSEIYTMRADGSHVRRLTHSRRANDEQPNWGVRG